MGLFIFLLFVVIIIYIYIRVFLCFFWGGGGGGGSIGIKVYFIGYMTTVLPRASSREGALVWIPARSAYVCVCVYVYTHMCILRISGPQDYGLILGIHVCGLRML